MGVFLIVLNVLTGVLLLEFGAMKVYSHKVDFENNKTSGAGLAMGVLKGRRRRGMLRETLRRGVGSGR